MKNQSDSEFFPETDVTTDTDTDTDITSTNSNSTSNNPESSLLDKLSEDDISELTIEVYSELDEYISANILTFQNPMFYENMKNRVTENIFSNWSALNICEDNDEDHEEVTEFVDQTISVYLDIFDMPMRSISYEIISSEPKTNLGELTRKIEALQELNRSQPKQKTKEWHDVRNGLITASNLWKVFGSESQRNSLIYEKCKQYDGNGGKLRSDSITDNFYDNCNIDSAIHWGIKYEPVTVLIYEEMFQTKLGDFGCIPHPTYPFIGASPDGINIDPLTTKFGRMLEIKNIKNRDITKIPKEEYWVQTQIQMETCDLDECDFVETRFLEYETEGDFYKDTEMEYKGVILYFIEKTSSSSGQSKPNYIYMPLDVQRDKDSINDWIASEKRNCKAEGLVLFSVLYWYLDELSCILIQRNRKWFQAAVTKIEDTWKTIEKERITGYEHRNTKKHRTQVTNDSSGHMIHNLNFSNSICLVKLE